MPACSLMGSGKVSPLILGKRGILSWALHILGPALAFLQPCPALQHGVRSSWDGAKWLCPWEPIPLYQTILRVPETPKFPTQRSPSPISGPVWPLSRIVLLLCLLLAKMRSRATVCVCIWFAWRAGVSRYIHLRPFMVWDRAGNDKKKGQGMNTLGVGDSLLVPYLDLELWGVLKF